MTTTSTSRRSSSSTPPSVTVGGVHIWCSTRADGDFHRMAVPLGELDERRLGAIDLPWTMLDQRHGTEVWRVAYPGQGDGAVGDVATTSATGAVLGCWVADCAPLALVGATGEFGVVHAGWRGLAAGVIDVAVGAIGEPIVAAVLGPTIGPCCYAFGGGDLDAVAVGVRGDRSRIAARTRDGEPALDVAAAVGVALAHHGVRTITIGGCPGCTYPGFSHRVRRDRERHVMAVWRGGEGG